MIQPMLDGENGASSKVRDAGGDEGSTFERLAERAGFAGGWRLLQVEEVFQTQTRGNVKEFSKYQVVCFERPKQ